MSRWKRIAAYTPGIDESETPLPGSKEWVRENWDYERGGSRKHVEVMKLLHEFHIVLIPILGATLIGGIPGLFGLPLKFVVPLAAATLAAGWKALAGQWWCSTLTQPGRGKPE